MTDSLETYPSSELRAAIKNLQQFALRNTSKGSANVHNLKICENQLVSARSSLLRKTVNITKGFITSLSASEPANDEELLRSIDVIKSYYPLIEQLQQGSCADQKFAEQALSVIHAFNTAAQQPKRRSLRRFVRSLFYTGIPLQQNPEALKRMYIPLPATVKSESPKIPTIEEILEPETPSQHETDAFCMKAITLIQKHGLDSPIEEMQKKLKSTPLMVIKNNDENASSIVSFAQTVDLFPGETIELQGSFQRKHTISVPIRDSFYVRSESKQTGFPHPSQHCGWGLGEVFLPSHPQRLHLLPGLEILYHRKWEIAHQLLPDQELNEKAKAILQTKRQLFEQNKEPWLEKHRLLAEAILSSSIAKIHFSSYDHLANTYAQVAQICCQRPYRQFHKSWFAKGNAQKNCQTIDQLLKQEQQKGREELLQKINNKTEAAFINSLTQTLAPAVRLLLLEELSEKINFPPPQLNDLAKKIARRRSQTA